MPRHTQMLFECSGGSPLNRFLGFYTNTLELYRLPPLICGAVIYDFSHVNAAQACMSNGFLHIRTTVALYLKVSL